MNFDVFTYKRLKNAVFSDILFQWKHGFYIIYLVISLVYVVILNQFPKLWLSKAVPIVIFSDPTVLGIFFIGGILLLEKEQGILMTLSITPLRTKEYVLSKLISLTAVAIFSTVLITLTVYGDRVNFFYMIMGVSLTSVFFILFGFIIAARSKNLNIYILKIIPWSMLMVLPVFSVFDFKFNWIFNLIPSVAGFKLIYGAYNSLSFGEAAFNIVYLIIFNWIFIEKLSTHFGEKMIWGGSQ